MLLSIIYVLHMITFVSYCIYTHIKCMYRYIKYSYVYVYIIINIYIYMSIALPPEQPR